MRRVTVVGANGRLGSELVLRLRSVPDTQVTAICRNEAGSAFLRRNGVECRLGDIDDAAATRGLLGDADLVVNLAYAFAKSANAHRANRSNVLASLTGSNPSARVVLASTIMVYGPAFPVRFPDAYGIEKLRLERTFLAEARRLGRQVNVFRIGHALGDLQPLTRQIRDEVRSGRASAPTTSALSSNAIHVASIVEALLRVTAEDSTTLDLFNAPLLTWGDIYRAEADQLDAGDLRPRRVPAPLTARAVVREAALALNQLLPSRITEPAFGKLLVHRARRDLAATTVAVPRVEGIQATRWRALTPRHPVPGLSHSSVAAGLFPLPNDLVI